MSESAFLKSLIKLTVEMDMGRTSNISSIVVSVNTRSTLNEDKNLEATQIDGRGKIVVNVKSAEPVTSRSFRFRFVRIKAEGEFANWSNDDLLNEAAKLLADVFIESVGIDESRFVGVLH